MGEKESRKRVRRAEETEDQIGAAYHGSGKQVFFVDHDAELTTRSQAPSEGWLRDPYWLELLSVAGNRLAMLNERRGGLRARPEAILAALLMPDRKVYMAPAEKGDRRAIALKRRDSSLYANLRKLLQPHGLSLEKGMRVRYAIEWSDADSPIGEALMLDLTRPLEIIRDNDDDKRAAEGGSGDKAQQQAAEAGAGGQAAAARQVAPDGGAPAWPEAPARSGASEGSAGSGGPAEPKPEAADAAGGEERKVDSR